LELGIGLEQQLDQEYFELCREPVGKRYTDSFLKNSRQRDHKQHRHIHKEL
jgi:hypothetical protein